jgi:putative oxidoreductase
MRYVVLAARVLLGAMFVIFGLNDLLHFFKLPPPSGDALTWFGIMAQHHWMNFVGV